MRSQFFYEVDLVIKLGDGYAGDVNSILTSNDKA